MSLKELKKQFNPSEKFLIIQQLITQMSQTHKIQLDSQLLKLEEISNTISQIIQNNEDLSQIQSLDMLRKKIIRDIQLKNFKFESSHKKTIVSLISKNETIISDLSLKNSIDLKNIQNEKKRSQAYLRSY